MNPLFAIGMGIFALSFLKLKLSEKLANPPAAPSNASYANKPIYRQFAALIASSEATHGIPSGMLAQLFEVESAYRQDVVYGPTKSRTGAMGIAQALASTARDPGYSVPPLRNPYDPVQAIPWAAQYLRALYLRLRRWDHAIVAYNQGLGTVQKAVQQRGSQWLAAINTEGRGYYTKNNAGTYV
jgi:hypothetical protein